LDWSRAAQVLAATGEHDWTVPENALSLLS
jgi:hypothetical protein